MVQILPGNASILVKLDLLPLRSHLKFREQKADGDFVRLSFISLEFNTVSNRIIFLKFSLIKSLLKFSRMR